METSTTLSIPVKENDISFSKDLKKQFQKDTNWDSSLIGKSETISALYRNWLEYQLYLICKNQQKNEKTNNLSTECREGKRENQ